MSEHDLSRWRGLPRPRFLAAVGAGALTVGTFAAALATAGPAASGAAPALHPNVPVHGGFGSQGPGANGRPGSSTTSSVGWASANWSGYAETSSAPYTSITGSWKVPSVSPTNRATYSAAWAGIDGFNNNSLIQTGTEQDYYNGAAHYAAWWTTSAQNFGEQVIKSGCTSATPAASCGVVTSGDPITAVITETNPATSTWSITLSNGATSHAWSFTKTLTYTGPGASAEWILEAPTVGGRIAPLAHYSASVFNPDSIAAGTVNGTTSPNLVASEGGEMVQGFLNRQVVSIPSGPDLESASGPSDGFAISYGSVAPPAPSS